MAMSRIAFLTTIPLAVALFAAGPACADAIDGDWCHADGRKLSIKGPQLVTPGGNQITGDYDRHGFVYVVPAAEPDAGGTVVMVLQGETQMRVKAPSDPDQLWRRCGKPVS
jgi:hypothetical protein